MAVPRRRIALLALLAAGLAVAGAAVARQGADTVSGLASPATEDATTDAGEAVTTAPLAKLGSIRDRLERLPPIAPGDLEGTLALGGNGCSQQTLELGTLVHSATRREICIAPGGQFGVRLRDLRRNPRDLTIVNAAGRFSERVAVPDGWDWWGITTDGLVFCDTREGGRDQPGRLRVFGGGTRDLPSCPLTLGADGLLFVGPGGRSLVDAGGDRLVALRSRLASFAQVRTLGDRLTVVDGDLYRDGRFVRALNLAGGLLLGASRDGDVALLSDASGTQLTVLAGDARRDIDPALAGSGGAVAPDGTRLLVQRDESLLVELDVATLRPVAQIALDPPGQLFDWRPISSST